MQCLFPSMTLLLANWYRREELAQRVSYLFSQLPVYSHLLSTQANIKQSLPPCPVPSEG